MLLPDLLRDAKALVGVRRRHLDVDDRDVGLVRADLQQQIVSRAALTDDLEPRLLEQARDALAEQHRVVGEDDADSRRLTLLRVRGSDADADQCRGEPVRRQQHATAQSADESSASIADADSSAFGTKLRAGRRAMRAPKS